MKPAKSVPGHYYITLEMGCTIVKAANLAAAQQWGRVEYGRDGYKSTREATQVDIDWVTGMGGRINEA